MLGFIYVLKLLLGFCTILRAKSNGKIRRESYSDFHIGGDNLNTTKLSPNIPVWEFITLYEIYNSTSGEQWFWPELVTIRNSIRIWNFSSGDNNPCREEWFGLYCLCTSTVCHIDSLALTGMNLDGSLPESLGVLNYTTGLAFSNNTRLKGNIPASIGNMTELVSIEIVSTSLSGNIPLEIYTLKEIFSINIAYGFLNGSISPNIGNLTKLQDLEISSCLLSGSIPNEISHLPFLETVVLYYNRLTGSIPNTMFNNNYINEFYVDSNLLTGTLPTSLFTSTAIGGFSSGNNFIEGQVSSIISMNIFTFLFEFSVSTNMLTGTLPMWLSTLQYNNVNELWFDGNYFTGSFPVIEQQPAPLYVDIPINLNLSYNSLTGAFPVSLCNNNISQLSISNNQFTSTVPNCLCEQKTNLNFLYINNNLLSGTLPDFNKLTQIQTIYVQNNLLTGTIAFSDSLLTLSFVDLSNNGFTGSLPFLNTSFLPIQTFAAVSNCFSGTISDNICNLSQMTFLDLDGLSSGVSCQNKVWSGVLPLFTLKKSISGGIPLCLFNMSLLETLRIGGNSIQWSFPDHLVVSDSLSELSLSNNQLIGTIPTVIYNKKWNSLDFSFNKLSGVISLQINLAPNSSLSLQVNRLSGHIPNSLQHALVINILNGNLFSCDIRRNSLPQHDKNHKQFTCGSNSFNQAIVVWLVVLIFLLIVVCTGVYFGQNVDFAFIKFLKTLTEQYTLYLNTLSDKTFEMCVFVSQMDLFRRTVFLLTIVLCLVGLPVYSALSVYFKTVSNSYAWFVSAAYLSGSTPAIILLCLYSFWLIALYLLYFYVTQKIHHSTTTTRPETQYKTITPLFREFFSLAGVLVVNCVIILIVNGTYVYIVLSCNPDVVFISQVFFAIFKLVWNDFAVWNILKLFRKLHRTTKLTTSELTVSELHIMSFIVSFNTIIAPCLATAAVDPSCFVNVFIQPSPVNSVMPNSGCIYETGASGCTIVAAVSYTTVTFEAPFTYNYQCSSALLVNYASVYVYMYLISAFLKPIMLIVMLRFYTDEYRDSVLYILIDKFVYRLLKPANKAQLSRSEPLFRRERYILRLLSKCTVFLTFGVVFPPLAIVLCVAFWNETKLNELILGRFLHKIEDKMLMLQFAQVLSRDCTDSFDLLLEPLFKLVLPFAALFYACFIFDIYGDAKGWSHALWALVVMLCIPCILCFVSIVYMRVNKHPKTETISTNEFEMTSNVMIGNEEPKTVL